MARAEDLAARGHPGLHERALAACGVAWEVPYRYRTRPDVPPDAGRRSDLRRDFDFRRSFDLRRGFRESCECGAHLRIDLRELRKDVAADAVARKSDGAVRGILARPDLRSAADRRRLSAADNEQRPHDPLA